MARSKKVKGNDTEMERIVGDGCPSAMNQRDKKSY